MTHSIKRGPTAVIRWAEDRNARSVNCICNVGGASVIADEQVQFTDQGGEPSKRSLPRQIDWLRRHSLCDRSYNCLLIKTSGQDDLRIEALGEVISDRGKVLGWPATRR